ncbi:hypothetical protein WJX84_003584 [Apatococcus fuscideae]|uniref:Uncharacterized protein n=1 Tax=Apatococcus fuscideae TaxID=2026836 RepID=A0AAW1TC18_9CHLO
MAVGITRPTRSSSARAQARRSASSSRSAGTVPRRSASCGTHQPSTAAKGKPAVSVSGPPPSRDSKAPQWSFSTSTQPKAAVAAKPAARSGPPRAKKQSLGPVAEPALRSAQNGDAGMEVDLPAEPSQNVPEPIRNQSDAAMTSSSARPTGSHPPCSGIDVPEVVMSPTVRGKDGGAALDLGEMFAMSTSMLEGNDLIAPPAAVMPADGSPAISAGEAPAMDHAPGGEMSLAGSCSSAGMSSPSKDDAEYPGGSGSAESSLKLPEALLQPVPESNKSVPQKIGSDSEHADAAAVSIPELAMSDGPTFGPSDLMMSSSEPAPAAEAVAAAAEEPEAPPTPTPLLYSNAAFLASPRGHLSHSPRPATSPPVGPSRALSPGGAPSNWSLEGHASGSRGSLDDARSAFINPAFLDARVPEEGPATPGPQALMHSPPSAMSMTQLMAPLTGPGRISTTAAAGEECSPVPRVQEPIGDAALVDAPAASAAALLPDMMSPEPALGVSGAWPASSTPPGMPSELETPAAEQLLMMLQQQLPFASASARRLAASPLLKQMLRTQAPQPTPGSSMWLQGSEGVFGKPQLPSTGQKHAPVQMCESASAAAVAAAESDTEAQSKAEAATGRKLTESPARSAPASPQSSFPGFMPAHPAQDADSPLQTAAPLGADHATAEPERSGGFVALLEASLTELSGTSQELLRPAAASQSHGHTQTQATAGKAGSEPASSERVPTPVFRGFGSTPSDLDASLGSLDASSPASWLSGSRLSSQDAGDLSSALAPSPIAYPAYTSGASPIQQATPFLVLGCGRARGSSPEEQATPQFPLFGRPVQVSAPTAKQPLLSAPESADGWHTPPPRALPEPILVTEAVTSAVQVSTGRWLMGPSQSASTEVSGKKQTSAQSKISLGRGSMETWLHQTGLASSVATPARSSLQALWAKAAEAKLLRAAMEEAADASPAHKLPASQNQASQQTGSSLEAENGQLRAELESVQANLARLQDSVVPPVEPQPFSEQAIAAHTDAVAAKDAAEQMRQMAENAETVAFIFEAEKKALAEELDLALRRLAEAESAKQVEGARPGTPAKRLAQLQSQLDSAREAAEFANKAVEDAALVADAARADELAAKREMFDLRQQLTEQLTSSCQVANAQDATIHSLYSQLEEALAALEQPRQAPGLDQAWEQASLMEEMWTEENAQLRAALEAAHEELQAAMDNRQASTSSSQNAGVQFSADDALQDRGPGNSPAVVEPATDAPTEDHALPATPLEHTSPPGSPSMGGQSRPGQSGGHLASESSRSVAEVPTPQPHAAPGSGRPTPSTASMTTPAGDSEVDSPTGRGVQRVARSGIVSRSLAGGKWTPHIHDGDEDARSEGRSAPGTAQADPVQAPKPVFFGPHRFFAGNGRVDVPMRSLASYRQLGNKPLGLQAALSPTISSPVWGQGRHHLRPEHSLRLGQKKQGANQWIMLMGQAPAAIRRLQQHPAQEKIADKTAAAGSYTPPGLDPGVEPDHPVGPFHDFPHSPLHSTGGELSGPQDLIPLGTAPNPEPWVHRSPTKLMGAGPSSWASPARSDASAISIGPRGSPLRMPLDQHADCSSNDEPESGSPTASSAGDDSPASSAHSAAVPSRAASPQDESSHPPSTDGGGSRAQQPGGVASPAHSAESLPQAFSGLSGAASVSPRAVHRPRTARALLSRLALPGDGVSGGVGGQAWPSPSASGSEASWSIAVPSPQPIAADSPVYGHPIGSPPAGTSTAEWAGFRALAASASAAGSPATRNISAQTPVGVGSSAELPSQELGLEQQPRSGLANPVVLQGMCDNQPPSLGADGGGPTQDGAALSIPSSAEGHVTGSGGLPLLDLPTPGVLQAITNTHSPSPGAGGAGNPWDAAQSPSQSGGGHSGAATGSWWSSSSASNSFRGPPSPSKGQTPSNASSSRPPRPSKPSSGAKTVQSKAPRPAPLTPALSTNHGPEQAACTPNTPTDQATMIEAPAQQSARDDASEHSSTVIPGRPAVPGRGGAIGGRKQDDAEFRRRAAALGIRISPYFRRP